MDTHIIKAMVQALKPALKDSQRAEDILNGFWRDRIALIWDTRDVHTAANERELALTNQESTRVLQEMRRYHNKQCGLKWEDITSYIDEEALGRKLTQTELDQFVHRNLLTIARSRD